MYGSLQGRDKDEARAEFGKEQVHKWRRSYAIAPPEGESLEMTTSRAVPYFQKHIEKALQEGNNIFVSAHGNSLRAIIKYLDNLSAEEVVRLELATGVPIVYEYQDGRFEKQV